MKGRGDSTVRIEIRKTQDLPKALIKIRQERGYSKWRMDKELGQKKVYRQLEDYMGKRGPTLSRLLRTLRVLRVKLTLDVT